MINFIIMSLNYICSKLITSFFVVENTYEPSLDLNLLIIPSTRSLNISTQLKE